MSIWGCNSIEFKSCIFENLDQTAIYGINCGFKISNNTGTNDNQTLFKDNLRNIEIFNTFSNRGHNIIIQNANFEHNVGNGIDPNFMHHITIEASNELFNLSVENCDFYRGRSGLLIDGPAGYNIVDNTFDRVLLSGTLKETNTQIDLNSLKPGMYILQLEIGSDKESHKLIRL